MGLKYLLDSNILSEPSKPQPDSNVMNQLKAHAGEYATAVTVWHEMHYGIERLPDSRRKNELATYLKALKNSGLPILSYKKEAGLWLAKERARLSRQGLTTPFADGEIAAIAYSNHLTVVTRNVDDFVVFSDLQIENWFEH